MLNYLKHLYSQLGSESAWQKTWSLRLAAAACFIGHGILAYQASTNFGSEWSGWVRSLLPAAYEYKGSEVFLKTVALLDIVHGLLLFAPKIPRSALAWTLSWGAVTAISRLYFLGVFYPPLAVNGANALAECLKRTPNWVMPLFLVAATSPLIEQKFQIIARKRQWLNFAVFCQILGIFFHNVNEANGPFFEFELLKIGMPQWFFYSVTLSSALGVLIVAGAHKYPFRLRQYGLLLSIVPLTYICAEGFFIYARNLPGGASYTAIRFVSHFAQYATIIMWSHVRLQRTNPGARLSPHSQDQIFNPL